MVKCLNDGSTIARYFYIPSTEKCREGFLKKDYEFIVIKENPGTGEKIYRLVCPECRLGPSDEMTYDDILVFETLVKDYFKDLSVRRGQRAGKKIEAAKKWIIESEIKKRIKKNNPKINDLELDRRTRKISRSQEGKKIEKEKASELDKAEYRIREKYLGVREAKKWLEEQKGEKSEQKKTSGFVKELATPSKTYTDYLKTVLSPISWSAGGLIVSVLTGNAGFFFAALCFGLAAMIPGPEVLGDVKAKAEEIRKRYKNLIEKARKEGESDEYIRNLIEEMKAEVDLQKLSNEVEASTVYFKLFGKVPIGNVKALIGVKQFLRGSGFLIMVFTLLAISSIVPLAGLAGLILGFVGYFIGFNPEREPDKK